MANRMCQQQEPVIYILQGGKDFGTVYQWNKNAKSHRCLRVVYNHSQCGGSEGLQCVRKAQTEDDIKK